jgi:uncharacterized membrane protein YcjF (UPF0283 family)
MRSSEEYKALLAKINIKKTIYAEKELEVDDELEQKIQYYVEKVKKMDVIFVICFMSFMVLVGVVYEFFKYYNIKQYIGYVILFLISILVMIFVFSLVFKKKLKKLNKVKDKNNNEKAEIRETIKSLNNEIASLVVSIITLNEHYYELSNIDNEELLVQKWEQYTNEIIMAINKKYNYRATYTEYQEYLQEYENKL